METCCQQQFPATMFPSVWQPLQYMWENVCVCADCMQHVCASYGLQVLSNSIPFLKCTNIGSIAKPFYYMICTVCFYSVVVFVLLVGSDFLVDILNVCQVCNG